MRLLALVFLLCNLHPGVDGCSFDLMFNVDTHAHRNALIGFFSAWHGIEDEERFREHKVIYFDAPPSSEATTFWR
jgi:hypothetical protein